MGNAITTNGPRAYHCSPLDEEPQAKPKRPAVAVTTASSKGKGSKSPIAVRAKVENSRRLRKSAATGQAGRQAVPGGNERVQSVFSRGRLCAWPASPRLRRPARGSTDQPSRRPHRLAP